MWNPKVRSIYEQEGAITPDTTGAAVIETVGKVLSSAVGGYKASRGMKLDHDVAKNESTFAEQRKALDAQYAPFLSDGKQPQGGEMTPEKAAQMSGQTPQQTIDPATKEQKLAEYKAKLVELNANKMKGLRDVYRKNNRPEEAQHIENGMLAQIELTGKHDIKQAEKLYNTIFGDERGEIKWKEEGGWKVTTVRGTETQPGYLIKYNEKTGEVLKEILTGPGGKGGGSGKGAGKTGQQLFDDMFIQNYGGKVMGEEEGKAPDKNTVLSKIGKTNVTGKVDANGKPITVQQLHDTMQEYYEGQIEEGIPPAQALNNTTRFGQTFGTSPAKKFDLKIPPEKADAVMKNMSDAKAGGASIQHNPVTGEIIAVYPNGARKTVYSTGEKTQEPKKEAPKKEEAKKEEPKKAAQATRPSPGEVIKKGVQGAAKFLTENLPAGAQAAMAETNASLTASRKKDAAINARIKALQMAGYTYADAKKKAYEESSKK